MLLMLVSIAPLRRCGSAVLDPSPKRVQLSIKLCLMTLIMLDASLVMATVAPYHALAIVALLAPACLLGKWVYST